MFLLWVEYLNRIEIYLTTIKLDWKVSQVPIIRDEYLLDNPGKSRIQVKTKSTEITEKNGKTSVSLL